MIQFVCNHCGADFSVLDKYAGRKGNCKICHNAIRVPMPKQIPIEIEGENPLAIPMRTRRLMADEQAVQQVFAQTPLIRIVSQSGDPAEYYRVQYQIRGLRLNKKKEPVECSLHEVEITLSQDYPRMPPHCRMLTPIFHPNINQSTICIGDHWTAGEDISFLIIRIGEMIAYQAYNIKSPLNAEAAMWADLHIGRLPIDCRDVAQVEQLV